MFVYSRKVSTVERLKGQVPEIHKNEKDENTRSDPHWEINVPQEAVSIVFYLVADNLF